MPNTNKERAAEYGRRYRETHREQAREHRKSTGRGVTLKMRYGITLEDFNAILEAQNNTCAICLTPYSEETSKRFCVDHNHRTGQVRGILCKNCNLALGFALENIDTLLKMAEYLNRHRGAQ